MSTQEGGCEHCKGFSTHQREGVHRKGDVNRIRRMYSQQEGSLHFKKGGCQHIKTGVYTTRGVSTQQEGCEHSKLDVYTTRGDVYTSTGMLTQQ